jgi:lipopolysaccharide exporter
MGNSLTKRVVSGAGWVAASALIGRAVGFARAVVLARLLAPDDFGVFSMALTVVAALEALTRTGVEQSVIAARYSSSAELDAHLDTAWSVELLKRLAVAAAMTAAAPHVARFYGARELGAVLPVFGAVFVVQGLQNVGLFVLRKKLNFKRVLLYETTALAASAASVVLLALFVRRDVWALVWGELIGAAAGVVASYAFYPRRPRLVFVRAALARIFGFGRHAFFIGVASYVTTSADNVAVGRMLGAAALGAYALAYNLVNLSTVTVADVFNKATMPAYAELSAERPDAIAGAFAKVFTAGAVVLAAITATLWAVGEDFVAVVYGEKWRAAGQVLKALAVLGFLRGLVLVVSSVLLGMDRPGLVARGKLLEAALFAALLYPLVSTLGLTGAAWTGVVVYSFALVLRLRLLGTVVPGAPRVAVKILLRATACGLCGLAAGVLVSAPFEGAGVRLLGGASASVAASALAAWRLTKDLSGGAWKLPFASGRLDLR